MIVEPDGPVLVEGPVQVVLPDGSVYQGNSDGTRSWIPDIATANAMGFQWNNLVAVDARPGPVGVRSPASTQTDTRT